MFGLNECFDMDNLSELWAIESMLNLTKIRKQILVLNLSEYLNDLTIVLHIFMMKEARLLWLSIYSLNV